MEIRDYNGEGPWGRDALLARYQDYCRRFSVERPFDLSPLETTQENVKWIYPVMQKVIKGIEAGDKACIEIGVEFIHEDCGFPFGRILKANTARALRRAALSDLQIERVRSRIVDLLIAGNVPREYREYSKLLRKIGIGSRWEYLEANVDTSNQFAKRHYEIFRKAFRTELSARVGAS